MRLAPVFPVFLMLFAGCGVVHLGQSTPNDAAPSGTLLKQGSFNGQNTQSVSGVAMIYDQGGGSYVVRLSGISTPSETGLDVITMSSGGEVNRQALQATSGTKNYYFTAGGGLTFTQVRIYSSTANEDYGIALLQ